MLKILVDATGITNKLGGVGRYSYQLLQAFSRIDSANNYWVLLQNGLSENHPVWQLASDKIHLIPTKLPAIGPKRQIQFARYYSKMDVEVFHCLNSFSPLFHRYPAVITIHDIKYLKYPTWLSGISRIKSWYLKLSTIMGARKAKRIIAVSKSTKRDLIEFVGVNENKIDVIYEAAEPFNDSIVEKRLPDDFAFTKPYLFFLGEKRPHKNIEGLIRAFALFKSKYDRWNTKLVITGREYSNYRNYLAKTQELSLENDIFYTGLVPDDQLALLYFNAEIFIFPSFYEGFGLPILEAMQHGTPVITSNTSSMPEIAGNAALIIDPYNEEEIADAILRIMKSSTFANKLREKGYERVKQFSWEKTAQATLDVYKKFAINK